MNSTGFLDNGKAKRCIIRKLAWTNVHVLRGVIRGSERRCRASQPGSLEAVGYTALVAEAAAAFHAAMPASQVNFRG